MSRWRKIGTASFTVGAACALGFLSFVGMFALVPNIALCGTAAALAIAYEGQVYEEGISLALKRIFSKDYLITGIIQRFLEKFEEQEDDTEDEKLAKRARIKQNIFLKDFLALKKYLAEMEEIEQLTAEQKTAKNLAKKNLHQMTLFLHKQAIALKARQQLKEGEIIALTELESAARELVEQDHLQLVKEIHYRIWFMKIGRIFAAAGGVSSGLTALSSMQVGLAIFTGLNFIPGAVLFTFAAFAAVGCALLLYQAMSDIALNYGSSIKSYFQKKSNESTTRYVARCVLAGVALSVSLLATIATVGTAWFAAKQGAALLMGDGLARVTRTVSVLMMVIPNFIFSVSNSIDSVDDICNSDFNALWKETRESIAAVRAKETPMQFYNIPRAIDIFLVKFSQLAYLIGHVISIGATMDRGGLRAEAAVTAGAVSELFEDFNYRPGKKSEEPSFLLKLMLAPVISAAEVLRVAAVLWDSCFTGSLSASWNKMFSAERKTEPQSLVWAVIVSGKAIAVVVHAIFVSWSFKTSKEKFFPTEKKSDDKKVAPQFPRLSENWRKQLEICEEVATQAKQTEVHNMAKTQQDEAAAVIFAAAEPFAQHRNSLWKRRDGVSQQDLTYASHKYLQSAMR